MGSLLTLEDVVKQHEAIMLELSEIKRTAEKAGTNADKANDRIDRLERQLDHIDFTLRQMRTDTQNTNNEIAAVNTKVDNFDSKQDTFLANTWKLIFYLVIIVGGFLTILGGLVGIKITGLPAL